MELVKAMRTMKRMCDMYKGCKGCPMVDAVCSSGGVINHAKETDDILGKWIADHPEKTIADDFFEKHPRAKRNLVDMVTPSACASECGYGMYEHCQDPRAIRICAACWNRPVEE